MAGIAAPVTRPLNWPTLRDAFRSQWHTIVDRFHPQGKVDLGAISDQNPGAKLEIAPHFVRVPELAQDAKMAKS